MYQVKVKAHNIHSNHHSPTLKRHHSNPHSPSDNTKILVLLLLSLLVGVGLIRGLTISQKETLIHDYVRVKDLMPSDKFPKLTWDDFQGEPSYDVEYLGFCSWKVIYSFTVLFDGDKANVSMNAKCFLDKSKSWIKAEYKSKELLEHEQGHYYIGCICAMTFKKRVLDADISRENYQAEIEEIFQRTRKEFLELEEQYDLETEHFVNHDEQEKWDKDLIFRMNSLREYWWF